MSVVQVQVGTASLMKTLAGMKEAVADKAVMRALNRAVEAGNTEAVRLVRAELALKAKTVRDSISVYKARAGEGSANIVIAAKPVPLIEYVTNPKVKRGNPVRVKINRRTAGSKAVRGGFIATMRSGHVGVFEHVAGEKRRIKQLYSTSVRQFFKRPSAVAKVQKRAAESFMSTVLNQIKQATRGGARR